MKHITCLCAGTLLACLALFLFRFFSDGGHWASSPFNRHLYNSAGQLISGTLLDRDGEVLSGNRCGNSASLSGAKGCTAPRIATNKGKCARNRNA